MMLPAFFKALMVNLFLIFYLHITKSFSSVLHQQLLDEIPAIRQINRKEPINPLCTRRLFHSYMLDESICHIRGVGSILSLLIYF